MATAVRGIDEVALRKPTFRGGEPIELDGGKTMFFPKPCVSYRPTFANTVVSGRVVTDLGPEFEAALDELDDLSRERGEDEPPRTRTFIDALMRISVAMLRANYDLTDDQLASLLVYRMGDETSEETFMAIIDVARGRGLKATSGTTRSPT